MADSHTAEVHRHVHALLCDATEARITGVLCLIEGAWSIVHAIITTLHEGMPRPRPFEIEESGILAFEKLASQEDLQAFLASLLRGQPALPASCRAGHLSGSVPVPFPQFKEREYAARDFGVDWPCAYIEVCGGGLQAADIHQRFRRFLSRLPTKEPPFSSPWKLGKRLSIQGDLAIDRGSLIMVRCPLPLRLGQVHPTSSRDALHVEVEAHGRMADRFVLSASPATSSHDGRTFRRDTFAKDTQHGVVDSRVAGLPHKPFVVHEHFDRGCLMLKHLLFGEGKGPRNDSNDFAAGVSWLLHLLGFPAMSLGLRSSMKNLTHSPDLIARSPDGHVTIVGECSLADPADDKVGKLLSRARGVEDALARAGIPETRVVPVFFTAASGCKGNESAHFVQKHDLEELLRLAEFGGDPSSILLP